MKKKEIVMGIQMLVFSFITSILSVGCVGCGANSPGAVRVVGDSVSTAEWGYLNPLQGILTPKGYSISHIPENARSTAYTLKNTDQWLADVNGGIVLWNNGIWDCIPQNSATDDPSNRTEPAQYASYLQAIAQKMKAKADRVIFVTTTEIPGGTGCEVQRNQIAMQVLAPLGVEIIDLYAFTKGHAEWHGRQKQHLPTDVHFTEDANKIIAEFIADSIENPKH